VNQTAEPAIQNQQALTEKSKKTDSNTIFTKQVQEAIEKEKQERATL
jgi:hypothetical protein